MVLDLFKKIFNKKNKTGILKIDTSFVNVPKLSELSEENKRIVLSYLKDINLDNYESIIKYSESLVDKTNQDLRLLFNKISELRKLIELIKTFNEISNKDYYTDILVDIDYIKAQIEILIEDIRKTEIQSELKLIAFNEFIKKENKRKYDFLGISGNSERLKYLRHKNSLLEEKERLLITTKLTRDNLFLACSAYKQCDYSEKIKEIENILFMYKNSEQYIKEKIYSEMYRIKNIRDVLYGNDKELDNKFDYYFNKMKDAYKNTYDYHGKEYYNILKDNAFINIEIDKYAYEHRNDYKIIISEINEIIKKYETSGSSKWNLEKLDSIVEKYLIIIINYINIFKDYISDDIKKELKESLFHLNYFKYISNYKNKSLLGKSIRIGSSQLLYDLEEWYWDYNEEKEYYNNLSKEMLKKVAILNLPLSQYKDFEKRNKKILSSLIDNNAVHLLFDIYNDDFDIFDLRIKSKNMSNTSNEMNNNQVKNYLLFIYNKYIFNRKKDDIDYKNNYGMDCSRKLIHLDILYHLFKFLKIEDYDIKELFKDEYGFNNKMDKDLFKLLLFSYFKYLNILDDDRIEIIPPMIYINQKEKLNKWNIKSETHTNINLAKTNENIKAVYLPTRMHLEKIIDSRDDLSSIKYLFVKEKTLKDLKKLYFERFNRNYSKYSLSNECILDWSNESFEKYINNDEHFIKIITIPDNTKCYELSKYLDIELKKEKDKKKILEI